MALTKLSLDQQDSRIFNTVALMVASTKLNVGERVRTLGHASIGNGGGNDYEIVAAGTGTHDNGSYIDLPGSGFQAKGLFSDGTYNANQWGAVGDKSADDTVAFQAAVTYCVTNDRNLELPGICRITASINIDRAANGAAFDNYFVISSSSGGGVIVDTAISMFSSTIAMTTDPVTQLVRFDDLVLASTNPSLDAYVLHGARFLRTGFSGCSFQKIKCLVETGSVYTQTIFFDNCNVRRWLGVFYYCDYFNYDIKVTGGLWEAGESAFKLKNPRGCGFHNGNIEGMTGFAISYEGAQGLDVKGMYFEQNGLDLDGMYENTSTSVSYGVDVGGCYSARTPFTPTAITQANPVVVTVAAGHLLSNSDSVHMLSITGMVELNGNAYRVANVTATTFELQTLASVDVDGTGYTAFVADGTGRIRPYTFKWGETVKCVSHGNSHTGALHDITNATDGLIVHDHGFESLSNKDTLNEFAGTSEGTFTCTLTGCTTSPTATARYVKVGNAVTLYIPTLSATSNTTACTFTGLPTEIRPARQTMILATVEDNGTVQLGKVVVDNSTTVQLFVGASLGTFTNSGTKGVNVYTITYHLI